MTKDLEIVDDSGDEFYATNIPIPFYIRLKLDSEKTKYRAKILDEAGNTRSFYTGVTERNFLELHVPVIPLRDKGKIIVEIEVSDIGSEDSTKHQATIDYVSQEEYESIKKIEKPEEVVTAEMGTSLFSRNEEVNETPEESPELTLNELAYLTQRTDTFEVKEESNEAKSDVEIEEAYTEPSTNLENSTDEPEGSAELSVDEIAYLIPRTETLEKEVQEIEENLEIKKSESSSSTQINELNRENDVSAELSVDEISYLTQRTETLKQEDEKLEDNLEVEEFESRASAQILDLDGKNERSAELSVDEIAYLTQRAEILSNSEIEKGNAGQSSSLVSEEEE